MTRIWRKFLGLLKKKRVLIPLGAVVFLLLVVTFLVSTTSGARWLIDLAAGKAPGEITVGRVEGRLLGPLHLYDINVRNEIVDVRVGHVELDWNAGRLFSRQLHVQSFVVEDVNASLVPPQEQPPSGPSEPFAPPPLIELPLEIVIDEARASGVQLLMTEVVDFQDLHFSLRGRHDAYELAVSTRLTGQGRPPIDVDIEARGTLQDLTVERLTVRTMGGRADVVAHAAWYPEIVWDATAAIDSLQLGQAAPQPEQWPGRLSARLRTAGKLDAAGPSGWAELDTLWGEFRAEPVVGAAWAEWQGQQDVAATLDLRWATLQLAAGVTLADSLRGDVRVDCSDLGGLVPGLAGRFGIDATGRGTLRAPRLDVDVRAEGIAQEELQAQAAEIRARIGVVVAETAADTIAVGDVKASADLRMVGAEFNQVRLDSTALTMAGSASGHALRLTTAGPQVRGLVALQGQFDPGTLRWSGQLDSLLVTHELVGRWSLLQPARLAAGAGLARLDSLRLGQDDAEIRLGAALADSQWTAAADVVRFPLALANAAMPPEQRLQGTAEVQLAASGDLAGAFTADASAHLDQAKFLFMMEEVPDSLALAPLRFEAHAGADGVAGDFEARVQGSRTGQEALFAGRFALPEFRSYRDSLPVQPLTAGLTGSIPDLGFFNGLDARIKDVHGEVSLVVDVTGTVGEPDVAVDLTVSDAGLALPDLGLVVAGFNLTAAGNPVAGYRLSGGARSGDGTIEVTGLVPPLPSVTDPIVVTIRGDRFQLMNTPEVEAEASPDIEVVYDTQKLLLQGTLTLPVVQVEIVEMPEVAVAPSADVVVVDAASPPPVLPVDTWVDMQIVLGDEVMFRGFAFAVQLTGALRIQQHVPEPPIGNGDITITEGFYRAYGQNMTIDKGVISFAGPVENPALNVTAYRETPDGIIAGVIVTGTAENPELKIYSDPVMQETEAISYLLTGRPLDAGSGDDKAKVASTAALLGSNVLSSQLGSKIGLDEARIETGGELDEASLVTGKYLSPKVYLSYAMGLFDRTNLVRVRYIFNPKWAAQVETGTTMGTDLFYKIERGGD